jgi:hypothetical protein
MRQSGFDCMVCPKLKQQRLASKMEKYEGQTYRINFDYSPESILRET